jgi:type IV pilus assembly protein PilM
MPLSLPKRRARRPSVVGLDLEPSHIAAAEVTLNGSLKIDRAAVAPLDGRMLRDGELSDPDGLAAAISELFESHQLGRRVRIGLAHQRVVVRTLDLPRLEDRKALDAAVRLQAPDHIPMPMDEAIFDYQVLGPVDTTAGPRTRVVVVAVRRETVDRLVSVVRQAKLDLVGIDLSAFAMLRSLDVAPVEDGESVLYANVGGLINLAVASGRSCLFTRTAPGGLEALAFTLADQCSLTLEHARQWLRHVGAEAPLEEIEGDATIVSAARSVLLDGAHQVADTMRNTLNFYRTQDHAEPVGRAIITGPAATVPGFASSVASELRLPVESAGVAAASELEGIPLERLVVAAGLAVHERP